MSNFGKLSIDDVDLAGKRVLMRVDFNVPIKNGKVANDLRMRGALPSITKVLSNGASLILMSHMGRPKETGYEAKFSLKPVALHLQVMLGRPVIFAEDCLKAGGLATKLQPGQVMLLENLRFYKGEGSKKEPERLAMAKTLASYGDLYISDAFGTAHRNSASMTGVPKVLGAGACGYLIKKEIDYFAKALAHPRKPFVAIVGGAKVSDKILLLDNLIKTCDTVVVGGAMAYTFLRAQGYSTGKSKCETVSKPNKKGERLDALKLALDLLARAKARGCTFLLPVDHRCAPEFKDLPPVITEDANVPKHLMALDIGPRTQQIYTSVISQAKTAIWNGPMGVFEMNNYRSGTWAVARALAVNSDMLSIVGGGDTAAAAEKSGHGPKISHISTGGGASLELLEGKVLPGLKALSSKPAAAKL